MCGRFTQTDPAQVLALLDGALGISTLQLPPGTRARFNVAPSQDVLALVVEERPRLELLRWGFVPSWAERPETRYTMINARIERVASAPAYRQAIRRRRCLVWADGFYEWQKRADGKAPIYIRRKDRQPFAFAGLWDRWRDKGSAEDAELRTCAILTMPANAFVRAIHPRMPAVIPQEAYKEWLAPGEQLSDELRAALLGEIRKETWEAYAVDRLVNAPTVDGPQCIEPAARHTRS